MSDMMTLIERLRERAGNAHNPRDGLVMREAANALEALQSQAETLIGRIGTHGPGCHTWGPQHYECLVRERAADVEALREIAEQPTGGIGCNPERFVKIARARLAAHEGEAT